MLEISAPSVNPGFLLLVHCCNQGRGGTTLRKPRRAGRGPPYPWKYPVKRRIPGFGSRRKLGDGPGDRVVWYLAGIAPRVFNGGPSGMNSRAITPHISISDQPSE